MCNHCITLTNLSISHAPFIAGYRAISYSTYNVKFQVPYKNDTLTCLNYILFNGVFYTTTNLLSRIKHLFVREIMMSRNSQPFVMFSETDAKYEHKTRSAFIPTITVELNQQRLLQDYALTHTSLY
jgi:hypothetical protein